MKVIVVGGGVIGLATAWSLARRGADVVVVERDRCGAGASAGNAGWITPGLSAPMPAPGVMRQAARWMLRGDSPLLVRPRAELSFLRWSLRFARSCRPEASRAGTAAILALACHAPAHFDLLEAEGVDFEMHEDGLLYLVRDERALDAWVDGYARLERLGFDGRVAAYDRRTLAALEPALASGAAVAGLVAGRERHVRPETLVAGLVADLRSRGVLVEEGVTVRGLHPSAGGWRVETTEGAVEGDRAVVAAGVWSRALLLGAGVDIPLEAAKGYSVTATGPDPPLRRPLYLTEAKIGASPFAGGEVRAAGTLELSGIDLAMNHRRLDAVAAGARAFLPGWRLDQPRREWAGLRPLAADGVPIVGEARDGLFVATGHAMLGVTLAPSTGEALAPAILGEQPPTALAALSPLRFARRDGAAPRSPAGRRVEVPA